MIKREELSNPDSCMSRAKDDEMTFVLLERDKAAPDAIRYWAWRRIDLGKNTADDPQIKEALECARRMDAAHSTPAAPQVNPFVPGACANPNHQFGPHMQGEQCDNWHPLATSASATPAAPPQPSDRVEIAKEYGLTLEGGDWYFDVAVFQKHAALQRLVNELLDLKAAHPSTHAEPKK